MSKHNSNHLIKSIDEKNLFNTEWKKNCERVISKGYDSKQMHIILEENMIDTIIKTSPARTPKHYQIGKIVQIRRGAGIDRTDLVLLRLPDGQLISYSDCAFFSLDESDNLVFEKYFTELYRKNPELNHNERWFTYEEDYQQKIFKGSIIKHEVVDDAAKDLLRDISIITKDLHEKLVL